MFQSTEFWAIFLALIGVFWLLPAANARWRAAALAAASLVALYFVVGLQLPLIIIVAATPIWLHVAIRLTHTLGQRWPTIAWAVGLLPILVAWVVGKEAAALEASPLSVLFFIGFSFVMIKCWTFLRDYHDGRIGEPELLMTAGYIFYFPTYISGPMHYFGEFDDAVRKPEKLNRQTLVDSVFRAMLGLVKIQLLVPLVMPFSLVVFQETGPTNPGALIGAAFAYSLVIWLDFSGYCDLAIALSRILGLRVPENFNNPYFASNIREFWQRWHITFSRVLTSYMFIPLVRTLQARSGLHPRIIAFIAYVATFAFCGYWHGPTLNFLLWGLYHAAGLIVYDIYRSRRRSSHAAGMETSGASVYGRWVRQGMAVALTFSFVSMGWILFALPLSVLVR
jgi:D-alanyl-lipoteichoic acid acyltransferase DltB (MBOAT superfamily)